MKASLESEKCLINFVSIMILRPELQLQEKNRGFHKTCIIHIFWSYIKYDYRTVYAYDRKWNFIDILDPVLVRNN